MDNKRSREGLAVFAAIVGAALLSGCGRLGASSRVDPLSVAVYPGGQSSRDGTNLKNCGLVRGVGSYSRGAVDLDCFVFPEDRNADIKREPGKLAYARAVSSVRERNRLAALLFKHSDDICVEEMGRLTANEATVNSSLNILATAATTTANIVTGDQAQQILAGVGTFAGASRSHLNSGVYRNTVAYAISRAITLERARLRTLVEARYGNSDQDFTVDEAVRAANEYHGVCSFYKGLELVLASVEGDQRSKDAQQRRAQIDLLEQQILQYRQQMRGLTKEEQKPYEDKIEELIDRIQALTLAGVPLAERPAPEPNGKVETDPKPAPAPPNPGT